MEKYILGIDNGNTVCKAVLFNLDGVAIASSAIKIETFYPKPGHSERNMLDLWNTNASIIKKTISKSKIDPKDILAIGSTGHGNGVYLLDKYSKPLKAIQSLDSRAGNICKVWDEENLIQNTYPYTYQKFWAAQTNSLLAWIKQHEPELFGQIGSIFLCKDFINYCLTNKICSDFSDFGATNLLDIKKGAFNLDLLRIYGLEKIYSKLPQLYESHQIIGNVTEKASKETGLEKGTPVVAGMIDVDASLIGSGVTRPGEVGIVAGTWSINSVITDYPIENPCISMSSTFAIPKHWKMLEASATSVTNLEWFINQFCKEEREQAKKRGISIHQVCDEIVSSLSKKRSNIFFHPFLHGSNIQTNAKAGFYGISGWHTKKDMLAAVYSGIVFAHMNHMERLSKTGLKNNKVILTGGGAKSDVLGQMLSNALNIVVEVPSNSETGAWGVAIAAGIGVGVFKGYQATAKNSVIIGKVFKPIPEKAIEAQSQYLAYKLLIQSMEEPWNRINNL